MDLSHGQRMVAIPGPSVLPEVVRAALARPMPDIYAGDLVEVSNTLVARLPGLVKTTGHAFIITGNGHAAWQMALSNTLVPGDKVLVLESGRFAVIWGEEYAKTMGLEVEFLPGDFRNPVSADALAARLAREDAHEIRAILTAHTDTASSVRNDIPALRAAIDSADHPALLMVDCIASLGCERYEMDAWGVDVTIGASQKGLMCPPGVSFVWANERATTACERVAASLPGKVAYFDWARRIEPSHFYELFAGTPPVAHIYALTAALGLIDDEGGLEQVWDRHEALASGVRAAVEAWSSAGFECNVTDPAYRSHAVTTIRTGDLDANELRERCSTTAGVTLGIGFQELADYSFRIGHMGHLNVPMLLGTLGAIEATLVSMGAHVPTSGVGAAAAMIGTRLG